MGYEPRLAVSTDTEIVPVRSKTVILTDAQIKALPTTAIELVAAPGASKFIFLQSALIVSNCQAGTYISGDFAGGSLGFSVVNSVSFSLLEGDLESLLTDTSQLGTVWFQGNHATAKVAAPKAMGDTVNQPLTLVAGNGSGNYTGGNAANTLKVTVLYVIMDV